MVTDIASITIASTASTRKSDIYLFIYFAHQVTILKRKKSDKTKIIEQFLMAWQHKDIGITLTNANSL